MASAFRAPLFTPRPALAAVWPAVNAVWRGVHNVIWGAAL